jgi:hypothetical protein
MEIFKVLLLTLGLALMFMGGFIASNLGTLTELPSEIVIERVEITQHHINDNVWKAQYKCIGSGYYIVTDKTCRVGSKIIIGF